MNEYIHTYIHTFKEGIYPTVIGRYDYNRYNYKRINSIHSTRLATLLVYSPGEAVQEEGQLNPELPDTLKSSSTKILLHHPMHMRLKKVKITGGFLGGGVILTLPAGALLTTNARNFLCLLSHALYLSVCLRDPSFLLPAPCSRSPPPLPIFLLLTFCSLSPFNVSFSVLLTLCLLLSVLKSSHSR